MEKRYVQLATFFGLAISIALIGTLSQTAKYYDDQSVGFYIGIFLLILAFIAFTVYTYGLFVMD